MGTLGEFSLYAMKDDDERFGMKKGDIFIGAQYDMDPEKISVGFRVSDGFDPGCNQYRSSVRKLTATEINRVVWKKVRTI
jgi:hypothetical protein